MEAPIRARRPSWCHSSKKVHSIFSSNGAAVSFPSFLRAFMTFCAGIANFSL